MRDLAAAPPGRSISQAVRQQFPGAQRVTYLDVAARGLLSNDSRAALNQHLDELCDGLVDKQSYLEKVEKVRRGFAHLVNARADEIAFTKNVSEGLNTIAAALPWQAGDNVVLCTALEHPNNIYPWLHLEKCRGIQVREVADDGGAIDIEAMIAAMDARTRLVTLSPVTFAPGLRVDIGPLGRACRANGTFLLADAAQAIGVIDLDVRRLKLDGLAVSAQKGLLGLYGMGFLYCRSAWIERMTPPGLARFGVDMTEAGGHEAAMGARNYALMPGARRFDRGNYNYPAIFAVAPSLDLLLQIGTSAVECHVVALARKLADGMRELELPVNGSPSGTDLSHIVTVGRFSRDRHKNGGDPEIGSLYRYLSRHGVRMTVRRGMLRFSMHLYNDESDICRVLVLARTWRSTRRRS